MAIGTCSRITTQRDLRRAFWSVHDQFNADRRAGAPYRADVRCTWVDFIDDMCRDGVISDALAARAVLEDGRPAGLRRGVAVRVSRVGVGGKEWDEPGVIVGRDPGFPDHWRVRCFGRVVPVHARDLTVARDVPAGSVPPVMRTARDIVAAITANVADVNANRIDWEEFTRRQFATWDAVADRPRLHDRVLSLLRT